MDGVSYLPIGNLQNLQTSQSKGLNVPPVYVKAVREGYLPSKWSVKLYISLKKVAED